VVFTEITEVSTAVYRGTIGRSLNDKYVCPKAVFATRRNNINLNNFISSHQLYLKLLFTDNNYFIANKTNFIKQPTLFHRVSKNWSNIQNTYILLCNSILHTICDNYNIYYISVISTKNIDSINLRQRVTIIISHLEY